MPLWSRRREPELPGGPGNSRGPGSGPPPAGAEETPPSPAPGVLACSRQGCPETTGVACRYVDRRGRRCPSAWCPAHQLVVQGRPYCLRHGGVVKAVIAGGMSSAPLPDLDNRAPSLVQFVAAAVNDRIIAMLHETWPGDLQAGAFPVKLSYLGPERRRSWSRKWTLYSHRGDEVAVSLIVAEDRDDVVIVRVDSETAAEITPPWISHRSTAGDPAVREAFHAALISAAQVAVEAAHRRDVKQRDIESESWVAGEERT